MGGDGGSKCRRRGLLVLVGLEVCLGICVAVERGGRLGEKGQWVSLITSTCQPSRLSRPSLKTSGPGHAVFCSWPGFGEAPPLSLLQAAASPCRGAFFCPLTRRPDLCFSCLRPRNSEVSPSSFLRPQLPPHCPWGSFSHFVPSEVATSTLC